MLRRRRSRTPEFVDSDTEEISSGIWGVWDLSEAELDDPEVILAIVKCGVIVIAIIFCILILVVVYLTIQTLLIIVSTVTAIL